ncbi:MAG TPA: family 20 glycosylhydrolase, partial [Chitinophagaceae bacterium]|nr:family 20 glycosylhydrolase [Chitinophagaceae bacterium]
MKSTISLLVLLFCSVILSAQQLDIIPQPAEVKIDTGSFHFNRGTVLVVKNGVDDNAASFLNDYIYNKFGFKLKKTKAAQSNFIQLVTVQTLVPGKEGAYSMTVSPNSILIQGQTASGTFYGMQTLIQLLPTEQQKTFSPTFGIPCLQINDLPRFSYRGMHLDVGRHFFSVEFVKRYIDYLALHKFNTFHWHLTEDQGWRIQIKKYPNLTKVGAWRNGTIIGRFPGKGNDGKRYGGFYTQAEIKEVVRYAAARFIEVIPEIEMPGHSSAAIASYPQLSCFPNESTKHPPQCAWYGDSTGKQVQQTWGVFNDVFCAGKENTFKFLQDVIDEIIPLFPSKYIHVGGDECPKENWKRCPLCQQRMKENNLKNEHELQSYFIQRMEKHIKSKGKTLIGWDEILEGGLAPNAVVMSWRGEEGGTEAARQKHKVIMTPDQWVYLNYSQTRNDDSVTIGGYLPLQKVYNYEPVPHDLTAEESKYVLGAQGNLWTEYIGNETIAQYMLFPRMSALSEVLWTPKEKRNYKDFEKRLPGLFKRYEQWGVHYSKAYFDLNAVVIPSDNYQGVMWKVETNNPMAEIRWIPSKISSALLPYTQPIPITMSSEKTATLMVKDKIVSSLSQSFYFNKATGKKITLSVPPSPKYSGDGGFTLVNGVHNEKGLARSNEFLGFEGTDCEAIIDLGKKDTINLVVVHALSQPSSWIYLPSDVEAFVSMDGENYSSIGHVVESKRIGLSTYMNIPTHDTIGRYVKVVARNYGTISGDN